MDLKKIRNQLKKELSFYYPDSRFAMRTDSEYNLIKIEIKEGFCTPDVLAAHIIKNWNLSAQNNDGVVYVSDKNAEIQVDFSVIERLKPILNQLPGNLSVSQFTEIILSKIADNSDLIKYFGF